MIKNNKDIKEADYEELDKNEKIKDRSKDNSKNALFITRFFSWIIDFVIVYFVAILIASPFLNSSNLVKLSDERDKVINNYIESKIDINEYLGETYSLSYQIAKHTGIYSIINIVIEILYFVVLQFYTGGLTLGRKLTKIRLKSYNGELSINQLIVRCLLINLVFSQLLSFVFLLFNIEIVFVIGSLICEFLQYTFIILAAIFIITRNDRRSLHDLICNTYVVKEG